LDISRPGGMAAVFLLHSKRHALSEGGESRDWPN
jgi:hypothetical protein